MSIDKLITEKADYISYSQAELINIAASSNHLREIIKNKDDFSESFLGGSYKRATMVKGVSDVDVYFKYIGNGNPQTALSKLRQYLIYAYPNSIIKQDKPSILVDFQRIPFNITPLIEDNQNRMGIPNKDLTGWQEIRFGELEDKIANLRARSSKYIDLIKVLKLWNYNYKKGIKNFEIEEQICKTYMNDSNSSQNLANCMLNFFNSRGLIPDAIKFANIVNNQNSEILKSAWLKFIENR